METMEFIIITMRKEGLNPSFFFFIVGSTARQNASIAVSRYSVGINERIRLFNALRGVRSADPDITLCEPRYNGGSCLLYFILFFLYRKHVVVSWMIK